VNKIVVIAISIILLTTGFAPIFNPPEICKNPGNLIQNCQFNDGASGWQQFTEAGSAGFSIMQGGGECHAPDCPAGHILIEDHFVGGIYQQVPAVPGNTYHANVIWLVYDSLVSDQSIYNAVGGIGRKMGIDPLGGTDPTSPNVVWGPETWENLSCRVCDVYQVKAQAQADKITVFLRIDDRWRHRAGEKGFNVPPSKDQFWIDDVGVMQIAGEAPPPATNTPEPEPTATPEPIPTATPEPEPTSTPEIEEEIDVATAEEVEEEDVTQPAIEDEEITLLTETTTITTPAIAMVITETNIITETSGITDNNTLTDVTTIVSDTSSSSIVIATSTPELEELPKLVELPPTITPTATPTITPTPEGQLVASNQVIAKPPAVTDERVAPSTIATTSWLMVAGPAACVVGVALIFIAMLLGGGVWLYRIGQHKPAPNPAESQDSQFTVTIVEDD